MSLSLADLDQIMKLFDQSGFSEMKLESGDLKLHLRKAGAAAGPVAEAPSPMAPEPVVPAHSAPAASALPPLGPGEIDVLSPLLGVYYRAPKPGEPPFIEVGQIVEADSIIGIVEVMKLMNSVRAGATGLVVAIHAANADMVEYEQPLIRIRTTV
ncbi:MAG: acetyl-CoA carboxylase biotin carboxyl carrier protein [Caulobacteraceae bacterium]